MVIQDHLADPNSYIESVISDLSVRKTEKDRYGEVFTPPTIINAMLDRLPPDVWTDPTKKWLDPAAGFGNFFMVVYTRLMVGLSEHPEFKDLSTDKRSQHIIKRMLYMVEYNPESCTRIREIFGENVNLFCGSFLDTFIDGTTQFDVIVGNPPFNADQTHEGKKGGGSNLWPKFVEKSIDTELLLPNGYLVFVHPALWRKPPPPSSPPPSPPSPPPPSDRSASIRTLFNKMVHHNHMLYLEIHSKPDGKRDFGVQTRYDFYVIQKRRPISSRGGYMTHVKDQNGKEHHLDLSIWKYFLPNHSFEFIQSLLASAAAADTSILNNVIFSRCQYGSDQKWVSDTQDETHLYPLVHSTPKNGPRILWSSIKNKDGGERIPMFGVSKVIFGESGINDVIVDIEGKYGMTQGAIGLKIIGNTGRTIQDEGLYMKHALESREFSRVVDAMSFSNFRIDWRMFLYFRPDFFTNPLFHSIKKC